VCVEVNVNWMSQQRRLLTVRDGTVVSHCNNKEIFTHAPKYSNKAIISILHLCKGVDND